MTRRPSSGNTRPKGTSRPSGSSRPVARPKPSGTVRTSIAPHIRTTSNGKPRPTRRGR